MLKKILFAAAPMMLVASSVMADDNLLAKVAKMDLNAANSSSTQAAEVDELGQADVDALLGDDETSGEEAIAACFRRIGYGYGYRSRGFYGYRSCYRSYGYFPSHRFCYRPVTYRYCAPVYTSYAPIYSSYWGCW
ncbi:MAG: hypothetical protein AAGG48_18050 [Planctomycetota bacterium]